MPKFQKKPVVIEAMQFVDNETAEAILRWAGTPPVRPVFRPDIPHIAENLAIDTLEGTMSADVGDWIIRGVQGEFYPCKPDIFEQTYEPVKES